MAAAREKAIREARGEVLGMNDGQAGLPPRQGGGELVWAAGGARGGAGRPGGCARAGAARRAVADADGPTPRARAHQGRHPRARAGEAVGRGGGQCAL